MQETKLHH